MKNDTILIIGAAAVGLFLIARMTKRPAGSTTAQSLNNGGQVNGNVAQQIFNSALPGQPGWGWQYFSDGTAIGPDGSYYFQGSKVWSPT